MNNKVVVYYRDRKGGKTLDYQQRIAGRLDLGKGFADGRAGH
jgi:hypothetical protein